MKVALADVGDPHPTLDGKTGPGAGAWSSWTRLGALDGDAEAVVDARGAVSPSASAPTVDWMVAGEDRWYDPRREVTLRQSLVDGSPVVETRLRVKGGDVFHRAYAIERSSADGGGASVVVEFENTSPVPCALALVVRPDGPDGPVPVREVTLQAGTLRADGLPVLVLASKPGGALATSLAAGDIAADVAAGEAVSPELHPMRSDAGDLQAALVVPVAHGVVVRAVIPVRDEEGRLGDGAGRFPNALPSAAQVAAGWRRLVQDRARAVVPDPRLAAVLEAALPTILAAPLGRLADGGRSGRSAGTTARWDHVAALAGALDAMGCREDAALLLARAAAHHAGGAPVRGAGRQAASGTSWLVAAFASHVRIRPDRAFAEAVAETTAQIVALTLARPGGEVDGPGDLPAPGGVQGLLRDAAEVLEVAGEVRAARRAARTAERQRAAPPTRDAAAPRLPPGREVDVVARALSARLALLEGDVDSAWRTLDVLLDAVSPTGAWPRRLTLDEGATTGESHCVAAVAAVAWLAVELLGRADADGVHLLSVVPERWLGRRIEVHGVVTELGTVSCAVRWHGERPALLWDVEATEGPRDGLVVDAVGLDPAWRGAGPRGEALLAPVDLPEQSGRGAVISGLQIGRTATGGGR